MTARVASCAALAALAACTLLANSASASASATEATATTLRPRRRGASLPDCLFNPPCPPPQWAPEWQLNLSTATEPGVTYGFLNASFFAKWGWVSLDWSVAESEWLSPNLAQSTNEEVLVEQARQIKALNPRTRVTVYRQFEAALGWQLSARRVMFDAASAGMFVQFTDGRGNKNGTIYDPNWKGCATGTASCGGEGRACTRARAWPRTLRKSTHLATRTVPPLAHVPRLTAALPLGTQMPTSGTIATPACVITTCGMSRAPSQRVRCTRCSTASSQ